MAKWSFEQQVKQEIGGIQACSVWFANGISRLQRGKVDARYLNELLGVPKRHRTEQEWDLVLRTATCAVYKKVAESIVEQANELDDHLDYFKHEVLDWGRVGLALYCVHRMPYWVMEILRSWPSDAFVRIFRCFKSGWQSLVGDVNGHVDRLNRQRGFLARKLGGLARSVVDKSCTTTRIATMARVVGCQPTPGNVEGLVAILQKVETRSFADVDNSSSGSSSSRPPGWLGRHWYMIGVLAVIVSYRRGVYVFVSETLETAWRGWQQWIVRPLQDVVNTVRHDKESQIAVMSNRSLASDVESLERMVVDFARDTGQVADLAEISTRVQQGDLSVVLRPYERELQSPLRSLVMGRLVRSLLIQIQKTKVDVEVALSGIDKLLKSQQLVFGLIAALPAISVVWWCSSTAIRWRHENAHMKGARGAVGARPSEKRGIRDRLACAVREIEVVCGVVEDDLDLRAGLVLCEVGKLRRGAVNIMTSARFRLWERDLDMVEECVSRSGNVEDEMRRFWLVYRDYL